MIYFSSDQHFWHTNVISYCGRPYSSVEEMNQSLVENWNATVKPDDEIYCLGDFSLAIRPVTEITPRLNGKKYLVPGNHDWCHSYNKKSRGDSKRERQIEAYTEAGWIVLPEQTIFNMPDVGEVVLCHHPRAGDFPPEDGHDKYAAWRPKNEDKWLLCGHVHETWKIRDKMINVGVDVWDMKPVSIDQLKAIILSK